MVSPSPKERPRQRNRARYETEKKLAQAVRNSLNLPRLRVRVGRSKPRRSWRIRLEQGRTRSPWVELDSRAVAVMKKVGLVPPLHLGTLRLAYAALEIQKSERQNPEARMNKPAYSYSDF